MKALQIIAIFTLCASFAAPRLQAAPSVEMTPIPKEVKEDGARRKFVQFRCRKATGQRSAIDYMPPWPIGGSGTRAFMSPKDSDASATISVVELGAPLDLSDEDAVKAAAANNLPRLAEQVKLESIAPGLLQLNGQPTVEVTFTYSLFGRSLKHSLLLCRREVSEAREVFLFELSSKPQEFTELQKTFRRSLYSIVGF